MTQTGGGRECSESARPRKRRRSPTRRPSVTPSASSSTTMPFTIATDGQEMMRTQLRGEFELLPRIGEVEANRRVHEASFVQ
jgi:hypothetical protein